MYETRIQNDLLVWKIIISSEEIETFILILVDIEQ